MRLRDYGLAGGGLAFAAVALMWVTGAPASAAGHHVDMENYAFAPRALTVQRGDSVTWMNHDEAPHDAKSTSGPASFHSPMLNQGGSWTHTFNTAGTYSYYCTVHPDMKASIVVSAPEPEPKPEPSRSEATNSRSEHEGNPSQPKPSERPKPKQTRSATVTPSATPTTASPTTTPTATTPAAVSPAPTVISGVPQQGNGSALSPLLLLAGLVTAVAVFCLLALASRPSKEVREQTAS